MGVSPRHSCPACDMLVTRGQRFCSRCGARLIAPGEESTLSLGPSRSAVFTSGPRFPPGAMLAQRYRIVSLLGSGGMGEVYRADDLLLDQPVALKFLPASATSAESALSRLRSEVRIARQLSHPNVCRVYDIGEAEGLTYLTMEYVDGEDLASLLRRIGKLPQDKALEVARKLCAGLAAAHQKGVVHRDLKPANIMLDGQGQVRITDFGLAAVAERVTDIASGTPAYMAPEQRAGKEVTPRSDIYALGIVLHEIFTGKRPSRDNRNTELDPMVERVILRCLHDDPQLRPVAALAVAAALPGGNPLAAALAAGETPSPDVVANAGAVEGLCVQTALACIAATLLGLAALFFLRQNRDIINAIPMEHSPEVLAARAREIARTFGYSERPVDTAFGWKYATDNLRYIADQKNTSSRQARVKSNRPPAVYFWYRESPQYLISPAGGWVTRTEPHRFVPGMLDAILDSEGRLIEFHAQPPAERTEHGETQMPEWGRLFAAADLQTARFTPSPPVLTPPSSWDSRAAWTGSWVGAPGEPLRVEAAGYQGRPVFFRIIGPWSQPGQSVPMQLGEWTFSTLLLFLIVLPAGAGLLAWRNDRIGRGDRRGAFRLALFAFACALLGDLFGQNHVPAFAEVGLLFVALRQALIVAAIFWILYMAFEPYVRRRSPSTLISWSRLLAGRWRDPLVAADVLTGIVLGIVGLCVLNAPPSTFQAELAPQLMASDSAFLSMWFWKSVMAVGGALSYMFLLIVMLLVVRRTWLAASLFVIVMLLVAGPEPVTSVAAILALFHFSLVWFALTRFGVLTTAALIYVNNIGTAFPLTVNRSAWYAESGLIAIGTILALAGYAFHTTLASRRLWRGELQDA